MIRQQDHYENHDFPTALIKVSATSQETENICYEDCKR